MRRATVFEEHASVLPHWFGRGLRGATLVCLDAHLDLQFVDEARIARLRACGSAEAMAALQSPHPLSPERGCFGIEDFLYPAARLGIARRLVWVAPPHALQRGLGVALGLLQQMESVTLEQLESFRHVPGGWVEGELLGLPLAIGTLETLRGIPLQAPVALDIDTDWFVTVPDDRVWADPAEVVASLKQWLGADLELTIARSVGTGFLPLRDRALADRLAALWAEQPEPGTAVPKAEDAAADLVRRLGEFRARGKPLQASVLLSVAREVASLRAAPGDEALAWVALGLLQAGAGRLDSAIACDAETLRRGPGHPELALEIARLLHAAGRPQVAQAWLERAAADDETRVAAWYLMSQAAAGAGRLEEAWQLARRAQQAAPAWPQLAQWVLLLAGAREDAEAVQRQQVAVEDMQRRLQAVRQRWP